MQLTISIPTYNRNETLKRNLALLLPQLTAQCKLVIIDNCSPVPVEETLHDLLLQYPDVHFEIIRNTVNIGANANITRCLELCDTPWLWMVGDDDSPQPKAVETIFQHIEDYPDAVYINFAWDERRPHTYTTRGLDQLVQKLDASANLPWISSSVRRADAMRQHVKFGYQYCYSLMPHVAILLVAVGDKGLSCLSREAIVKVDALETPLEQQWSGINLALGYPVLLDLPMKPRTRKLLSRKLLLVHWGRSLSLRWLTFQLLVTASQTNDWRTALYLYDQIVQRDYYFEKDPKLRLKIQLGRLMMRFPRFSLLLNRLRRGTRGSSQTQDRYERV